MGDDKNMSLDKDQNKSASKNKDGLHSVEKLALINNVSDAVLAGVLKLKGWTAGKRLSKNEFLKAVDAFLGGK